MTSNRDRLGGFEERLLGELKSVVAHRNAEQSAARPARARLWRRRSVVSVASAGALRDRRRNRTAATRWQPYRSVGQRRVRTDDQRRRHDHGDDLSV